MRQLQPFQTVREILRRVLTMHLRSLRRYTAAVQEQPDDPRRRAVVAHLRRCESELATTLARYDQSDDDTLQSFVQSVPAAPLAEAEEGQPVDGAQDLEAVLDSYRDRDRALIQVYDQLRDSLVGPRASTIFADLAEQGRRNQQRLQVALLDF